MPTIAELKAMTPHVRYEWHQLCRAAVLLRKHKADYSAGKISKGIWCCFVESFAIHVRNAIEFFYVDDPRPTDIRAEHYVRGGVVWPTMRPRALPGLLGNSYIRAHKQVAHLTIERATAAPQDFEWPVDEIMSLLNGKLTDFKGAIDAIWTAEFSRMQPFPLLTLPVPVVVSGVVVPGAALLKMTAKTTPD